MFLILSTNFVLASDVAYVIKHSRNVDEGYLKVFEEMNLEVDIIEDKDLKDFDFSGYKFIFLDDYRLRNIREIPTDFPIIIANQYYGSYFGLLEMGRILKVAANSKLSVKKDEKIIEVYSSPFYGLNGLAVPYYYIPEKFKGDDLESVADATVRSSNRRGYVTAFSNDKKCFFGITNTKYWTEEAKELFIDCINFVLENGDGEDNGNDDGQNDTGQNDTMQNESIWHDVMIDNNYVNSVNGIRIRDDNNTFILGSTAELMCNKKYRIDFKTVNVGNFTENVSMNGSFGDINWISSSKNLKPGRFTTAGSKTITINYSSGVFDIVATSHIPDDNNLSDNTRTRNVKIIC